MSTRSSTGMIFQVLCRLQTYYHITYPTHHMTQLLSLPETNMKIEGSGYVTGLECEKIMCSISYL